MNMTEKNGQPSMEEILASIRRIIAEEPTSYPHNGELRGTPIVLKGDGVLEDASDFDLPAIFRASPPPPVERPAPLLGRLTDAIRNATAAPSEPRAAASDAAEDAGEGLSSLKSARAEAPTERAGLFNGQSRGASPSPASLSGAAGEAFPAGPRALADDEPKRVMAPFKDTHFVRMSSAAPLASPQPSSPFPAFSAPPSAAPFAGNPMAADFGTIVPGELDRASLSTPPMARAAPIAMPPPPLPAAEPARNASDQAPPANAGQTGTVETGTIEDATADLLRPMLRQWLADNMPRMVEKALHIEIAESLKVPKKL